jgi:hypothetical protein
MLHQFLQKYRFEIGKCARRTMTVYPPEDRSQLMCLCLTEFVTQTWKTLYVRAERKPSPLGLTWKQASDGMSGRWVAYEVPKSGTIVVGGFGNHAVRPFRYRLNVIQMGGSDWVVGSNGIPIKVPSERRFGGFWCCFTRSREDDLVHEEPTPSPLIKDEQ